MTDRYDTSWQSRWEHHRIETDQRWKAHRREHELEELARARAAELLAIELSYIKIEKERNAQRISALENLRANLEGRFWALSFGFLILQFVVLFVIKIWK